MANLARAEDVAVAVLADRALESANSLNALILQIKEVRPLIVATAIKCLAARKVYYDRDAKTNVEIDDGNTQMRAVTFLAAYSDGLPTQTTLNVSLGERGGKGGELTVDEAMQASPALRAKLRAMLDGAEQKALKQADPPA